MNRRPSSFVVTIILCIVLASVISGQGAVMTNKDVMHLVREKLSGSLIINKIRASRTNFDVSTDAIIGLKKAGVSEEIISAMIDASGSGYSDSSAPATAKTKEPAATSNDDLLNQMPEPGIYLSADGKLTAIEPTVYSGNKSSFWGTALTYGVKKSKIRAVVRGRSANMQVKATKPEFYFLFSREYGNKGAVMSGFGGYAATSPAEFMMIAMKVKENSREATLGEFNAYSSSTGAMDKEVREFSFEKIRPGLYKVTPKVDLGAGEYCFFYAGTGGAGSKIFDFGVSR